MKNKKCICFYLTGFLMVLALLLYSRRAGSDELRWILRPVAWWSGLLGGISFEYEQGVGYVNHSLRFIIAPACAGIKFWMTACLMLICSFVHRLGTRRRKLWWTIISFPAAGMAAVFVNGIRIVLAIYLPIILRDAGGFLRGLTEGQLHTAIGTMVYFLALLGLYRTGDEISRSIAGNERKKSRSLLEKLLPTFWYLGPVLGLPFLSRMAHGDYENFTVYELPVLVVCGSILLILFLWTAVKKRLTAVSGTCTLKSSCVRIEKNTEKSL